MSAVADAKRLVVKVGTSTLTYENGRLNLRRIESLVKVLSDLKNAGREIKGRHQQNKARACAGGLHRKWGRLSRKPP